MRAKDRSKKQLTSPMDRQFVTQMPSVGE